MACAIAWLHRLGLWAALACTLSSAVVQAQAPGPQYPSQYYQMVMQDIIQNADLFTHKPEILTANYAFEGIKGVINGTTKAAARAAGGTWNTVPDACANVTGARTTVQDPASVATGWGWPVSDNGDAMPVVFSWPVLPSTVQATDFELTLNTGEKINPEVASILPNTEYNERHVVVIFGQFGNRLDPASDSGAVYVTQVKIMDDGTPLHLVGPKGPVSAVGLTYNASCCVPYGVNARGPRLVAAKLSVMSTKGEGPLWLTPGLYPNHCRALYGKDAQYRLRMYTSGGFSPDGVRSLYPTDYANYFRVQVRQPDGNGLLLLNQTGVTYKVRGAGGVVLGKIKVLGLADLGMKQDSYDPCYAEDHDNYIDICIRADRAAVKRIVAVEMPHGNETADPQGLYAGLFNPGGPGNDPTPGVKYTVASGYQVQPVMLGLADPMTVSYNASKMPLPL